MLRSPRSAVTALVCLLPLACSSTTDEKKSSDQVTGETWTRLIEGKWSLGPGGEEPRFCVKQLVPEDMYISAIRPVHPKGTHHTLLTIGDETSDCTTAVANGLLYAAGLGSEGLQLPEGVAIKVPAGKYLNLGLHLYNTGDTPLEGTSAMEVITMKPEDVQSESEALLAGPFDISIPPGEHTITGSCTLTADQKMYAFFPHAHQLGVHMKTTVTMDGTDRVIHDAAYDFAEQLQYPLDPILDLHSGDVVTTACTYQNPGTNIVTFGESSDTEMCFSVMFRYPAQGQGFCAGSSGTRPTLAGPACVAPGAPGNEIGVGKECSKDADCSSGGFCLAAHTLGEFGNFCSTTCTSDDECGAGATCQGTGQKVCVPSECTLTAASADAGATTGDGGTATSDAG